MSVAYALQTLAEVKAPGDIVVEEAPSARPVMQAYLPITRSETFYTMDSGGLGYGMPAAVGVALGKAGHTRHLPDWRRIQHVLDPGALERGTD